MTAPEALALIDQTLAQISLPREGHQRLAQAVTTLRQAIAPAPPAPVAEPHKS